MRRRVSLAFVVNPDQESIRTYTDKGSVKAPRNYKDPVKIAEYEEKEMEHLLEMCLKHPLGGKIESVGMMSEIYGREVSVLSVKDAVMRLNKLLLDDAGSTIFLVGFNLSTNMRQLALQGALQSCPLLPEFYKVGGVIEYVDPVALFCSGFHMDENSLLRMFNIGNGVAFSDMDIVGRVGVINDLADRLGVV